MIENICRRKQLKLKIGFFSYLFCLFLNTAFSQDLIIYTFNPRNPDDSDYAAGLIKINFYDDGLIKSYEESYHLYGSKIRQVTEAFRIVRKKNTIKQEYSKNRYNYKTATFTIHNTSISIIRPEWKDKAGIRFEKEKKYNVGKGVVIFNQIYEGKSRCRFIFSPKKTRIEYINISSTIYEIDPSTKLPYIFLEQKIESDNVTIYRINRDSAEKTWITVSSKNGPPIEMYRIEGQILHTQPYIAVINYFLFAYDPGFVDPLFPYFGGSPYNLKK